MFKIRLSRAGRKDSVFYLIIATDSRKPRDSGWKYKLGHYNPYTKLLSIDRSLYNKLLQQGAAPTSIVSKLISRV